LGCEILVGHEHWQALHARAQVIERERGQHAITGERRLGVDVVDEGVGVRAAKDRKVRLARKVDVGNE